MAASIPRFEIASTLHDRMLNRYRIIDGYTFKSMVCAGLTWLRANQELVNSLNVFPVPDGDTGTNMVLTMQAAVDELSSVDDYAIGKVAHAIAHGALMGARGNSGVILSQLWRGFARTLADQESMDAKDFVSALREARDTAYKGVVKPVEGTILTVSKDIAAAAEQGIKDGATSALEILELAVSAADDSVERTPDLLPVLKEAGVVDSGGMGLFFIFEGALRATYRQPLDKPELAVKPLATLELLDAAGAIEPGQDWEVVIDFRPSKTFDLESFYGDLDQMGTSIQVGEGDGIYRMHIHVPDETEYQPIDYVRGMGTITRIAIENLMDQLEANAATEAQIALKEAKPGQIAIVSVAPGQGFSQIFASLGVNALVKGGQTMNPSTQEIIDAFEPLPSDHIILLPNNKNIILAAQQAVKMTKKTVAVVPSVSVPQGIAALFAFNADGQFDHVVEAMKAAYQDLQWCEITTATRSVEIDGVQVEEGQVISLVNGKLTCSGDSIGDVLLDSLEKAQVTEAELVTLYYGVDLSHKDAQMFSELAQAKFPEQEFELHNGGQPHYQFIVSIE
jgi:DAK2 domain fusion protein YloV